ncbi:serine/threonine protein kinase [Nocardioides guangzhouensis]|uniref:non-specific serine/threonine protein kinase n=1 Tax=Nocardioides guangzhouensis TaxID=2497878 RepID=A0A4Q4ZAT8_9ACTN|nr:serine/threonine-protein kinase [Nocardioides guangzhouensis]RYP85090.1 serine/threonine protein kinase [Nocardioides guangzhouensis]
MNRLQPGFILSDRYRLERRVASGGMADVWAAEDDVLRRMVALKVMRPDPDHEELFALRFRDEALHSAGLIHTNIATLFDYGEDDGLAFLVMELVDGRPLSQLIRERGRLPAEKVRSVLGQCALALGVAHAARLVHRDVKPANILVRDDGLVKLTDFGIARAADASGHTRAGDLLGTPSYISPEQALGRPATGASDLYALGVVGHEMLSGAKPFDKPTPIATAMSHIHEPPPPLPEDVPEVLAGVIEDLLAKDPTERPANARAVAVRLGLADHELMGLALGLAQAVYGESALSEDLAREGGPAPGELTRTVSVNQAALLDD